jgi:superfamily II DNA/RNA helicase
LRELGFDRPTVTQAAFVPRILAGQSLVLGAATGTGKTVAYLAPLLQLLKRDELERGVITRRRRPRAIILAPTRELCSQILSVVKRFGHVLKLRSTGVLGGTKQAAQRAALDGEVDVVVATPGRLSMLHEQSYLFLSDVRCLVVDEADTMMSGDDGFLEEVQRLLTRMRARPRPSAPSAADGGSAAGGGLASATAAAPEGLQVVLAGATMPAPLMRKLAGLFPDLKLHLPAAAPVKGVGVASGPSAHPAGSGTLHVIPPNITQEFRRVGGAPAAKHLALSEVLSEVLGSDSLVGRVGSHGGSSGSSGSRTRAALTGVPAAAAAPSPQALVFCNSVASARSTAFYVAEQGFSAACLHGDIPPDRRAAEFALFRDGRVPLLICTDAAARGLDFPAASTVVMFDFPRGAVEYVHRAGRVGRAGRPGRCVALCGPRDDYLATGIQRAAEAGLPIDPDMQTAPHSEEAGGGGGAREGRGRSWGASPAHGSRGRFSGDRASSGTHGAGFPGSERAASGARGRGAMSLREELSKLGADRRPLAAGRGYYSAGGSSSSFRGKSPTTASRSSRFADHASSGRRRSPSDDRPGTSGIRYTASPPRTPPGHSARGAQRDRDSSRGNGSHRDPSSRRPDGGFSGPRIVRR